jgi:methylmalonyl-CoA mutase, C-terminal domain
VSKILIAKTSLDGHWRGVTVVATALRDAGHEVVLGGMLRPAQIAEVAVQEDVDLIGLNVGGRVEVVDRILACLDDAGLADVPMFCGGTVAPKPAEHLLARGVEVYPPGSTLGEIVAAADRLISRGGRANDSPGGQATQRKRAE